VKNKTVKEDVKLKLPKCQTIEDFERIYQKAQLDLSNAQNNINITQELIFEQVVKIFNIMTTISDELVEKFKGSNFIKKISSTQKLRCQFYYSDDKPVFFINYQTEPPKPTFDIYRLYHYWKYDKNSLFSVEYGELGTIRVRFPIDVDGDDHELIVQTYEFPSKWFFAKDRTWEVEYKLELEKALKKEIRKFDRLAKQKPIPKKDQDKEARRKEWKKLCKEFGE